LTVYVDDMFMQATVPNGARKVRARWSHMTADTDEELHAMARKIGLKRAWAQHMDDPNCWHRHYDVTESRRAAAVAAGAVEITWRDAANRSSAETMRLREQPVEPEQGTLL
jgi:hypothetical protein